MDKEALFRRHVRMSQIKYNLPMKPNTSVSKRHKLLGDRLLGRKSLWLVFSYKLDYSIKNTINIIQEKIKDIDKNISKVEAGQLIDSLHNENTEIALSRQYEEEIDKLQEMLKEERISKDELIFKSGILNALMDRLKSLMYLIGQHKKRLLDGNVKINHLRIKIRDEQKEEEENKQQEELQQMQLDSIKRDKSKTITNTKGSFQEDLLEEEKIGRRQTQAQSLMQRVVDDTDNIQDTQNTMREISELMNNFSQKIMEQDEIVTTIMHDAEASNANIKEAGKELKKAHEYQKGQDKLVAAIYIIMALILLIYDRVTAIHY